MNNTIRKIALAGSMFFLVGCAAVQKDCASCNATANGADWIVVQLDLNGKPFRCWSMQDVSISNENASDGIWWQNESGNLIHISGLYNRVQVIDDNWLNAYNELGLTEETCKEISSNRL
jgi:hypothetical protein